MRPKLLLVDDSVTIQRVVELTFAGEGIDVIVAGSSAQAIARTGSERPDIVLADIGMPEPDGYTVSAFIKGHPHLAGIPVVLLTSALEPLDEERMRRAGCDGVLVKPFEPHAVISTVKALLAKRREEALRGSGAERPARKDTEAAPAEATVSEGPAPLAEGVLAGGDPLEAYFDRLDAAFASLGTGASGGSDPAAEEPAPFALGDFEGVGSARAPGDPPSLSNAFAALFASEAPKGDARPASPGPAAADSPLVTDDVIDQIARRVIARLDDEAMRRLVLETAERIVREEIERIKQTSGAGPTRSAG